MGKLPLCGNLKGSEYCESVCVCVVNDGAASSECRTTVVPSM